MEALVLGEARLHPGARVGTLVCARTARLADGSRVAIAVDAQWGLIVGEDCSLGEAATSGGRLELGRGTTFGRLWGFPVITAGDPEEERIDEPIATIEEAVLWGNGRLSLPSGFVLERDLVAYADVRVGAGAIVRGTIKAHGSIDVLPGACVEGHLIARKDIRVAGAAVCGNVFAEGDVELGSGSMVGAEGGYKTVYAAGRVTLAPQVAVFGGVVATHGGVVR